MATNNAPVLKEIATSSDTAQETPRSTTPDKTRSASQVNPSFMQNQLSIQRSPSTTQLQASALSRSISVKSNASSYEARLTPSNVVASTTTNPVDAEVIRGRERGDSDSSVNEASSACTLQKSSSTATIRSTRSVRSVRGIGTMQFGSLRVHSPSPTRPPTADAHHYLKDGDIIIVRDIPLGCTIGCDMGAIRIEEKELVEGFKDLPPGAHFLWGSASESSIRVGFWFMSSKKASDELGEIFVKRWDKYYEVLAEEVSNAEIRIQKSGIGEIYNKLVPYGMLSQTEKVSGKVNVTPELWIRMTSSMKGALLTKVIGNEWNKWEVASMHEYKPPLSPSGSPENKVDYSKDEVLNFVFPRDTRTYALAASGRERTEQALDSSSHVMAVINERCTFHDTDEVIGEMQFCYITGMLIGNAACMEQWGIIVKVVFRAYRLILDLPRFMEKFIRAVHAQLTYDGEGITGSILDIDHHIADDLKKVLIIFKARLNEKLLGEGSRLTGDQAAVGRAFEELESYLWKWSWDLRSNYVRSETFQLEDSEEVEADLDDFDDEDELGEFAPVILDLDSEGRQRDRIRF